MELIATLDGDGDGLAEIAWWANGGPEIWDTRTGPLDGL